MNDSIVRHQQFSLAPQTFTELVRFAELVAKSDLAPKDYKGKPGNVMIAVQMGVEVGLSPMQAIQNIAVINGRPSVWGDAMLALCQAHPSFDDIIESDNGLVATCIVKRKGRAQVVRTFSQDDAKTAGLAGKEGPWRTNPKRMRQMRARAFGLRDMFADVLRGIQSSEEQGDIQATVREVDQRPEPIQAEHEPEQKALPRPSDEPYRFKSGQCEGMSITDVPMAYLQGLTKSKHPLSAVMKDRIYGELSRRNHMDYIGERLQASLDARRDDSEGYSLEKIDTETGEVERDDPAGLNGDSTAKRYNPATDDLPEPGAGDEP